MSDEERNDIDRYIELLQSSEDWLMSRILSYSYPGSGFSLKGVSTGLKLLI